MNNNFIVYDERYIKEAVVTYSRSVHIIALYRIFVRKICSLKLNFFFKIGAQIYPFFGPKLGMPIDWNHKVDKNPI